MVALFLERGITHFTRLFVYLCWRPKCGRNLWSLFFRTSNIHTLHSLVICVRRLIVSRFCYVCGCLFLERVISTHISTHLFACLFVLYSSLACMVASRLRRFVTSRLRSSRFAPTWRPVSDRHDPSTSHQLGDPCRIVTIRQLRTNLATRVGSSRSVNFAPTWRPVSDRHDPSTSHQLGDPSRIVTIRQLFRGRCTLPEVHFRYPFSRHDFRYDGR